jgi:hypothetical protein
MALTLGHAPDSSDGPFRTDKPDGPYGRDSRPGGPLNDAAAAASR